MASPLFDRPEGASSPGHERIHVKLEEVCLTIARISPHHLQLNASPVHSGRNIERLAVLSAPAAASLCLSSSLRLFTTAWSFRALSAFCSIPYPHSLFSRRIPALHTLALQRLACLKGTGAFCRPRCCPNSSSLDAHSSLPPASV